MLCNGLYCWLLLEMLFSRQADSVLHTARKEYKVIFCGRKLLWRVTVSLVIPGSYLPLCGKPCVLSVSSGLPAGTWKKVAYTTWKVTVLLNTSLFKRWKGKFCISRNCVRSSVQASASSYAEARESWNLKDFLWSFKELPNVHGYFEGSNNCIESSGQDYEAYFADLSSNDNLVCFVQYSQLGREQLCRKCKTLNLF